VELPTDGDTPREAYQERIKQLEASLMVLDATIYMILSVWDKPQFQDLFAGQIATAKKTYEEATGMESLIGFKREKP